MIRSALFVLVLALPGCGALGKLSGDDPVQAYELRAPRDVVRAVGTRDLHLTVETPETSGALNTDQILIRPDGLQASYLGGALWTDELPLMVQTLILRSLQDTGGYAYVGRDSLGLTGDYAILTELMDFQAELTPHEGSAPLVHAHVRLRVQIIRERDARVIATRTFEARPQARSDDATPVAEALDRATAEILPQIARWTLRQTGLRPRS